MLYNFLTFATLYKQLTLFYASKKEAQHFNDKLF